MDAFTFLLRDASQISHVRQLLFNITLLLKLSMSDFELYWPTVDNIYVIRTATKSGDFTFQLINCRFKRGYKAKPNSALKLRAASTKKAKHYCNVSFRLVKYANHVKFHMSRSSSLIHTHSLDESDANKRNSALLKHVQADITKKYAPAAVISLIRSSGQLKAQARLNAAKGVYLTRQNAINSEAI
jgi:hypothetical protein